MGVLQDVKQVKKDREDLSAQIVELKRLVGDLKIEKEAVSKITNKQAEINRLEERIQQLTIEKDRKEEEYARREREVTHKVGLLKEQQEFEVKRATEQAKLEVQQENLKADKDRFDERMKFQEERFAKEVDYLKDIMTQILQRLPTVDVNMGTARTESSSQ